VIDEVEPVSEADLIETVNDFLDEVELARQARGGRPRAPKKKAAKGKKAAAAAGRRKATKKKPAAKRPAAKKPVKAAPKIVKKTAKARKR